MVDKNDLENLPDELLVHIFSYNLEMFETIFGIIKYCITLQRVCKKFKYLFKNNIYNIQGLLNKKAKSLPQLNQETIVRILKGCINNKNYELIDILCYFDFLECHHIDYAVTLKDEPSLEKIEIFLYIIKMKEIPFHKSSTLLSVFEYIAAENDANKKEILKKIALRLTQAGFRIDTFKRINDTIQAPIVAKTNYVDFTFYFNSNLFIKSHMPNALTSSISVLCNNSDINYLREKSRIVKFLIDQSISPSLLEKSMENLIKIISIDHLQFFHPEIPHIAVKIYQNSLSDDHEEISFRQGRVRILLLGVEIAIKTNNSFAIIFFSNAYFDQASFSKTTLSTLCQNLSIKLRSKKFPEAITLIIDNYNCLLKLQELLKDNFINNMHVSNSSKIVIKNFINFSLNKLHFLPHELLVDWHEHCRSNNENPTKNLEGIISPGQINYVGKLFEKYHRGIYEHPYQNSFEEYLKRVSKRDVENEDDNHLIHGY